MQSGNSCGESPREFYESDGPIDLPGDFFMGDKQSMLEFTREPAGGGCGRERCFPVQCVVVARICQAVSHGMAAHAAVEDDPQRGWMDTTPVFVLAGPR